MDFLSDDLLINIAKRVAVDDAPSFCYFMKTNRRHRSLCRTHEVLRVLHVRCVKLLIELDLTCDTLRFSWRLWNAGHPTFCMVRCTQQLIHPYPKLDVVKKLLENALVTGSNSVKYFNVLIRATSFPFPDYQQMFKDFEKLLMTRKIFQYRHDILGFGTPYQFHCDEYHRKLPLGMVWPLFCYNRHNCLGDGWMGGYRGFVPNSDEGYCYQGYCIRCRLDTEIKWMMDAFGFDRYA
jgi:hypothetical protein